MGAKEYSSRGAACEAGRDFLIRTKTNEKQGGREKRKEKKGAYSNQALEKGSSKTLRCHKLTGGVSAKKRGEVDNDDLW